MNKNVSTLLIYAAGQATQIVIHAMCINNNMYSYKQIPFCIAAGFVLFFAVLSGILIAQKGNEEEYEPAHEAPAHKPYIDFVKEHTDVRDGIDEVIPTIYDSSDED